MASGARAAGRTTRPPVAPGRWGFPSLNVARSSRETRRETVPSRVARAALGGASRYPHFGGEALSLPAFRQWQRRIARRETFRVCFAWRMPRQYKATFMIFYDVSKCAACSEQA